MSKNNHLVSAIVSVYNCERFIAGCLEDLEQQTIADRLEIMVVNSGSQQNEEAIIKKFQEKYDNIVYIKTENRETIYQAWNRGIKAASGKYITNANSDDRHRDDAFEIMVSELENNKSIGLVYANDIITETENETFMNHTPVKYSNRLEFNRHLLLQECFIGPQPMWHKSIHKKLGYFDESLKVAGDYEFWLRIAEEYKFKHINEYLGLYLNTPNSAEHRDSMIAIHEREKVKDKYKYMLSAIQDKKLLKSIKRTWSEGLFSLGYFYFKKGHFSLAKNSFFRSITYNWHNFISYQGLIACHLSPKTLHLLKKIKRIIKTKQESTNA